MEIQKDYDIEMINNTYLLGVLDFDRDYYPSLGLTQECVTVMKNNSSNLKSNIVFYVKVVSDEPINITDYINNKSNTKDLYAGIDGHQKHADIAPFGFRDRLYKMYDDETKIEEIKKNFEGKLLLFKPSITYNSDVDKYFKNVRLDMVISDYEDGSKYRCIPAFRNKNTSELEEKLRNREFIYFDSYNHSMLQPEFIICGDYVYSNFKSWKKHETNSRLWCCDKEIESIRKSKLDISLSDIDNGDIIEITDDLKFFSEEYVTDILYEIADNGELVFPELYDNVIDENTKDINNISFINLDKNNEDSDVKTNKQIETKVLTETNITSRDKASYSHEAEFLLKFNEFALKNNLCYSMKDLVNLHVSIKTNPLTIIAGMSGTGKTQLARAYGRVLGISEENYNLLFLPISPSYTEPEDIIGFLNSSSGLYIPADTGLIDLLVEASNNPDKMYMVIYDEMNLSQVEHWFAPFLSLLELEPECRKLKLYSKDSVCHNRARYPHELIIGENIIFIGTVNLDETTKDFSDRLLDRANIVTLNKRSFLDFKKEVIDSYNLKDIESMEYSFEDYKSWIIDTNSVQDLSDKELGFLDELHNIIQKYDYQKGVSFRVLEKVVSYIKNIPPIFDDENEEIISRREAFDIEIKQRLLTKIRGSERQYGKLIGNMEPESFKILTSELYDFFNSEEAVKISDFDLTLKEIKRKAKELTLYGYTN